MTESYHRAELSILHGELMALEADTFEIIDNFGHDERAMSGPSPR